MQKLMTAGQALDWMMANELKEIEDSDGYLWRRLGRSLQRREGDNDPFWASANIGSVLPDLSWSIPERKLPKLPDGAIYVLGDGVPYVRCDDGYCVTLAETPLRAAVHRAVAEEFETRPK